MSAQADLLVYGCYGYTGRLIVDEALRRGLRPVLAGRNHDEVHALARQHGLEARVFGLDDTGALDAGLQGQRVVLHAAGPFSRTSRPMVDACLRAGIHYLDVTGEIAVFEAIAQRDDEAKQRGVVLMPGVGFDVVPSDCLAAHVAALLPGARQLVIALRIGASASQGTTLTMLENIDQGGAVRRDGKIVRVPAAHRRRAFDFGTGPRDAVTIPWGDVSTAFHSTGIPDIEVYLSAPSGTLLAMRLAPWFAPLVAWRPVQRFLQRRIKAGPAGPSDEQRARGRSMLYAEVTSATGETRAARLEGPEAYTLTAMTAVRAAERVLAGAVAPGFQTPSRGLGVRFVTEIPGVTITDA